MKNLALIGAGYWGKNLARNFLSLGALHTLCDASQKTLDSYGEEYKEVCKITDPDQALNDPLISCIAIATPAAMHYDLVKRALIAGKDVFVEKPLCLDVHEGRELIRLAAEKGRILMVGHLLQYHPCILAIQDFLAKGDLGKLQYITSNRLNLGKIRKEENALWSFAPHDISVLLSLVQGQLPRAVICTGHASLTAGVADTTLTMLDFGEVKAHVYVSWLNPFKEQKLTVVGSHGIIVFDDTKPWKEKLVIYRDHLTWSEGAIPTPKKDSGELVVVAESEPLKDECSHFLDCCSQRKAPITDGGEGLRVLQVLNAAQQSLDGNGKSFNPADFSVSAFQVSDFFHHPSAIVDDGAQIGQGSRVWHFAHVCAGAKIGKGVSLGQNVFVGNKVIIGDRCKVQNNVSIYDNVTLEEGVFCGPSMVFTNVYNPRSLIERKSEYRNTLVKKGATLGANCTIVCGTTIGEYAFVGAGAVVNKDVKSYALMVGVPARQIGWMSQYGEQIPLPIEGEDIYTCPHTGQRYELNGGTLSASSSQI